MTALAEYVAGLIAKAKQADAEPSIRSGSEQVDFSESFKAEEIFVKVLTKNDDSGRHGVLIPSEAYSFFPDIEIVDPKQNATTMFDSFDALAGQHKQIAFKYYQRYPERRITSLNSLLNDHSTGLRLQIVVRVSLRQRNEITTSIASIYNSVGYIIDSTNESGDGRFFELWKLFAGQDINPVPGTYIRVPVSFSGIKLDHSLNVLLEKFDTLKGQWFDSMRVGDTGVGYTFESLMGVVENNDKKADFLGIELKCKRMSEAATKATGKLNLFQQGPIWRDESSKAIDRIRSIGKQGTDGLYSCYSQLTTTPNNLLLAIANSTSEEQVELLNRTLQDRLIEKHSRAAFILVRTRAAKSGEKFNYEELIYCEKPSLENFFKLMNNNQLVFEFTMSEKANGAVRNHGYPWRLVRESLLDQLFAVKIKLR
jgi:MvaI/BcnI restriction endonuclease family